MTKAYLIADADNIQVMGTDNKYTTYFLSNGKYGRGGNSYSADLDGKWLKTAGAANDDKITAGQAFWYVSRTASKENPQVLTVAGSVLTTSAVDPKTCVDTYTLMSNPYACDVALNENIEVENATKAYLIADADNIQVMGADGKYTTYFLSNGKYGRGGNSYNPDLDGKWLKTAGAACTDAIPAGASFWYVSRSNNSKVQLKNPLSK